MMDLGERVKKYESAYDTHIIPRVPVIIRCDGKGFSRFTKVIKAVKPFDDQLSDTMAQAMLRTAEEIQGCVFGFTQSDEITFVLVNDQSTNTTPWFDNRIQKMLSVVSSILTANFNFLLSKWNKTNQLAFFDARVFAVPTKQEAVNTLIWRQNDCIKNSISCSCYHEVGRVLGRKTTQKKMFGLSQKQQQELLFTEAKINWANYPTKYKNGIGCYKKQTQMTGSDGQIFTRSKMILDIELPIFSSNQNFLTNIVGQNV